jgi:uncharacterized protein with FMN-binding domain
MRRIVIALMGTVSGMVLLFSYHTSTNSGATAAGRGTGGTPYPDANGDAGTATAPSPTGTSSSGTFDGAAVMTRWGTVQVEITVANGQITRSRAVRYPQGNPRDQEINAYALPQLNREVTQGQSASIDAISGATVTSDGYIRSLQSAIDKAHL